MTDALDTAVSPSSTISVTRKVALKSGSSQQGKARRASVASNCVVAITRSSPVPVSRNVLR